MSWDEFTTDQTDNFDDFLDTIAEGMSGGSVHADYPDVLSLIEEGMNLQAEEEHLRMDGFHPSFISGRRCLNAYKLHYQKEKKIQSNHRTIRVMDNGTAVHSRLQRYLSHVLYGTWKCRECHGLVYENYLYKEWREKMNAPLDVISVSDRPQAMPKQCPRCGSENFKYAEWRVIEPSLYITGQVDGLIRNKNGRLTGLEIKSASPSSFSTMANGGGQWLPKYKEQFGIYLRVLGLSYGVILLESKGNQELHAIPVAVDDLNLDEIFQLMRQAKDKVPEKSPRKHAECPTCPYYKEECNPK